MILESVQVTTTETIKCMQNFRLIKISMWVLKWYYNKMYLILLKQIENFTSGNKLDSYNGSIISLINNDKMLLCQA